MALDPLRLGAALLAPAIVLASTLGAHLWIGVSPLRPGFAWPTPDPRAPAALAALEAIPPDAPVSASSDLYPHLANRGRLYWFPATEGATWLALDTVGTTHPLSPAELRDRAIELLASGDYAIEAADAGVLVLRAGPGGLVSGERLLGAARAPGDDPSAGRPADLADRIQALLPDSFYSFASVPQPAAVGRQPSAVTTQPPGRSVDTQPSAVVPQPPGRSVDVQPSAVDPYQLSIPAAQPVVFGEALELVDWRLRRWPQVGLFGDAATLETVWRSRGPTPRALRFALVSVRRSDGAIVGVQADAAPGALWLPTTRWRADQLYRFEMPIDRLGGLGALGVAVVDPSGQRLPVRAPAGVTLWDGGTIARLIVGL